MRIGSTSGTAQPDSLLGKKRKSYQVARSILFGHHRSNGIHGGPREGVWAIVARRTGVATVEPEPYLHLGHFQDGKNIWSQHGIEVRSVLCVKT